MSGMSRFSKGNKHSKGGAIEKTGIDNEDLNVRFRRRRSQEDDLVGY
jgi:hypothetical protein